MIKTPVNIMENSKTEEQNQPPEVPQPEILKPQLTKLQVA